MTGGRPRRWSRAVTVLLVAATAAAAIGGFALLGWTAWQGVKSGRAAAAQQRAGSAADAAWRSAAAPTSPSLAAVPVARAPRTDGATVATIRVPRFGASWVRVVRQGVEEDVLNSFAAGVGHYPGTAMPGGVGNFAVAGHDTGWGDAFRRLGDLRVGDEIRVRDAAGTYTYAFRNFRWVQPEAVDVLLPVPERPSATVDARLITLTTCDPPFHAAERFVAYGELVSFAPAGGEVRSLAPESTAADRRALAALRGALAEVHGPPTRRTVDVAGGGGAEVTADRTSVGRAVPSIQVGVHRGGTCLIGQVGAAGVHVTTARPVAGRCLIGASGTVRAAS